jgi:hypothetical protein
VRLEGVNRPRQLPAPVGMPVPVGVEHRKAPERLPEAARTPWELRVSRRSADSRTGEIPWDAGSTHRSWRKALAQMPRTEACEGKSGGESRRDGSGAMRSEGGFGSSGTTAVEPGRAGSSVWESAKLPTSYSSENEAVGNTDERTQGCSDAQRPSRSKELRETRTPGAAADLACPRGRRESNPSRG